MAKIIFIDKEKKSIKYPSMHTNMKRIQIVLISSILVNLVLTYFLVKG